MKFSKIFNKITISRATQHFRGLHFTNHPNCELLSISRKIRDRSDSPPVLSKPNWFSLFLFLWNVFDNNGKLIFWACVPIQVFIRFLNTEWKMLLPLQIVSQLLLVPRRFGIFEGKEPVPQWANNYKQSNHVYTWMTCGCFEFCKLLLSKLYEN